MKNKDKKLQEQIKEEANKIQIQRMHKDAEDTVLLVEKEMKIRYNEYIQYAEAGDYKFANFSLKMFLFLQTLHHFGVEYVHMLHTQEAIAAMMKLISSTNKSFSNCFKMSKGGAIGSAAKNMKKFLKNMGKLGADLDKLMNTMSKILGGGKKTNGKALSDKELFQKTLADNITSVNSYETSQGLIHSTADTTGPTSNKPGDTTENFGGIGDPD